jgi:ATP-dependent protease HslVU (ClpYQ) peptidase subunit
LTTVIACRPLLTMVADSRISHGTGRFTSSRKIAPAGSFLAGISGDYAPALAYLKKFTVKAKGCDGKLAPTMPAYEGEFELMVMSVHGLWIYGEDGTPIEIEENAYAIGSGGGYANACLATQERLFAAYDLGMALEVACELDHNSALPMVELTLGTRTGSRSSAPPKPA